MLTKFNISEFLKATGNKLKQQPEIISLALTLASSAAFFSLFNILTSNTANILAWGFDEIPSLGKSGFTLFIYEFVHTSTGYEYLLTGLWLTALGAALLYLLGRSPFKKALKIQLIIWAISVTLFLFLNLILFHHPDSSHFSKYIELLITDPYKDLDLNISPPNLWFLSIPAFLAIPFLFAPLKKIPGSLALVIIASPLLLICWALHNYLGYHFMCYENPNVYSGIINTISPALVILPALFYTYIYFKKGRSNTM